MSPRNRVYINSNWDILRSRARNEWRISVLYTLKSSYSYKGTEVTKLRNTEKSVILGYTDKLHWLFFPEQ